MLAFLFFFLFSYDTVMCFFFFFQAEDGIRDKLVTGVQTCALPISSECASGSQLCTGAQPTFAASPPTRRTYATSVAPCPGRRWLSARHESASRPPPDEAAASSTMP